jgi:type I restriction enzyme S subunit
MTAVTSKPKRGWKEYILRDVTSKIGSGATPTGGGNSYKTSGITFIRSQNVEDFQFSVDGLAFIDDEQARALKNVAVEKNDILMNITGESVTRCCIAPKEYLPARVNQHVAIIRPLSETADFKYVFYYLHSIKPELNSIAEIGCTRRALTKEMLENLVIPLPSISEQRAMSAVLSSLDDKIDLLHRQNKTLEGMAEALWRKIFMEEVETEWEVGKLGDFIKTTSGGTPSRRRPDYYENGNHKWVKSKELQGTFIVDTEEKITDEALNNSSAKLLPKNSLLLAMYGATVGEYGILTEQATCNQAVCALLPNENYPYTFIYMFLKMHKEEIINHAVGSDQQNISQIVIQNFEVFQPNQSIIQFHKSVAGLFDKVKSNIFHIRTLSKTRDTLLPKLMSGEVRMQC